ncbi:hypothetical protein HD806DRAFT_521437 [Xylariaceae sp. AK1471]|nr:hypothetical protein HD806DRAFT_521437 [Xylariaceae sp. AK1471]
MATTHEQLGDDLDAISSWYRRSSDIQADVTKEAYDDAVRYLEREFANKPELISWLHVQTTPAEVLTEVEKVEHTYRSQRDNQTVIPWLRRASSFIMTYRQVFDTLAQHHPEYVSLVWGTLKFILMGIQNHEKLVHQFSTALSEIADVLPRAEFIAKLYDTDRTRAMLSRIYAYILLFLRQAVKWYARSSAERAISTILKPLSPLKCEGIVNQIRTCVKAAENEASISSQAEIRDIHVEILRHGRRLHEIEKKLDTTDLVQTQRWETMDRRMIEVQSNSCVTIQKLDASNTKLDDVHSDTQEIVYKITDVQATVLDTRTRIIQYEEVIHNLAPKMSPEEALSKQESIAKRAGRGYPKGPKQTELIRQLGNWVLSNSPPLLILHAGPRAQAQAKEMVTELIGVLQPSVSNVYWSLCMVGEEGATYRERILRDLLFQVIRASVSTGNNSAPECDSLAIEELKNAPTEEDLIEALGLLTQCFPRCFLVVGGDGLAQETAPKETLAFFRRITEKCRTATCDTRLLVLSNCAAMATLAEDSPLTSVVRVQWSAPPPARLRKLAIRTRSEKTSWMGIRKTLSTTGKEASSSSTGRGISKLPPISRCLGSIDS